MNRARWLLLALVMGCGQPIYLVGVDPPDGAAPAPEGGSLPPGGPATQTIGPDTPVANCPAYPTLGAMNGFLQMRCGSQAECHGAGSPWTAFTSDRLYLDLLGARSKVSCTGAPLIDGSSPLDSFIYVKVSEAPPRCRNGAGTAGDRMPSLLIDPKQAPLGDAEVLCVKGFVLSAAGGNPLPPMTRLQADPPSLDFGAVTLLAANAKEYVVLSNIGALPTGIILTTVFASDFVIGANDCSGHSLSPGGSCIVVVQFLARRAGLVTGALTFDAPNAALDVDLRGTGQ